MYVARNQEGRVNNLRLYVSTYIMTGPLLLKQPPEYHKLVTALVTIS